MKEDLKAAIKMKEEYIRLTKGRENSVGHSWEAVAEWFIDRFQPAPSFGLRTVAAITAKLRMLDVIFSSAVSFSPRKIFATAFPM